MAAALTFDDLRHKTVADLRQLAAGVQHPAVQGHTQMHKEQLLKALCAALGIEMHTRHEVVGLDKSQIKARIRELKKKRGEAIAAHDSHVLHDIRREMHSLKRRIHRATV
ncbi:MAG: hypothetical protein ACE148_02870 [Vicinamibacterales bacterium]